MNASLWSYSGSDLMKLSYHQLVVSQFCYTSFLTPFISGMFFCCSHLIFWHCVFAYVLVSQIPVTFLVLNLLSKVSYILIGTGSSFLSHFDLAGSSHFLPESFSMACVCCSMTLCAYDSFGLVLIRSLKPLFFHSKMYKFFVTLWLSPRPIDSNLLFSNQLAARLVQLFQRPNWAFLGCLSSV